MRDPTVLGRVESATGSTISVALDPETLSGLVYIDGRPHRVGQVGSFVRIPQGFTSLFGIITQAGAIAAPTKAELPEGGRRWLTVEIVGESTSNGQFSRGVYRYPTIGDDVHLVTEADLGFIYGAGDSPAHVEVGVLSSAPSIPARVDMNRLVTRHCAVVGATGSGKSTTVAGLVDALSDVARFPSARILLLDIHGEYATAFRGKARIFRIQADPSQGEEPLVVPYWALTFDELLPLTFGNVDDSARGRLVDWITKEKRVRASTLSVPLDESLVTVDTPLPFSLKKLWYELRFEIDATYPRSTEQIPANAQKLDPGDPEKLIPAKFKQYDGSSIVQSRSTLNLRRQLELLAARLRDPRLAFLFCPDAWTPDLSGNTASDLDALLAAWLGDGKPNPRPVTILDVSGVPAQTLTALVGALLRLLFDALFWGRMLSEGGRERPLLVVMEEAHLYLKDSASVGAQSVARIVKEGRKYGIGAMVVSQRPAEIDSTILSQCGTFVALRMGNAHDRQHVTSATSESLRSLMELLPTLRTGEAIIVGEAVQLPTRVLIRKPPPDRLPASDDPVLLGNADANKAAFPGGWDRRPEPVDYKDLVTAWRRQNPTSPRKR